MDFDLLQGQQKKSVVCQIVIWLMKFFTNFLTLIKILIALEPGYIMLEVTFWERIMNTSISTEEYATHILRPNITPGTKHFQLMLSPHLSYQGFLSKNAATEILLNKC